MLPVTIKHLRMHQSRTMLFLFTRERPIPLLIILFLVSIAPGDSAEKSSCKLAFSNIWMFEWRSGKADFEESFCEDNFFLYFQNFLNEMKLLIRPIFSRLQDFEVFIRKKVIPFSIYYPSVEDTLVEPRKYYIESDLLLLFHKISLSFLHGLLKLSLCEMCKILKKLIKVLKLPCKIPWLTN